MTQDLEVAEIFRCHGDGYRQAELLAVAYFHVVFTLRGNGAP